MAVSGLMSVRNSKHELDVKKVIRQKYDIPIICAHELVNSLGFYERTVTAVLNARLLPIITEFLDAVNDAVTSEGINAPIYVVKGNGNLASFHSVRKKPIETILSGPAASVMGALYLTNKQDAVIVDMGGTTTDSSYVMKNRLKLSSCGAKIGKWQTKVSSAQLYTYGLGGDTEITPVNRCPLLTNRRVLPACRGNLNAVTPTDVLHFTKEFVKWDRALAVNAITRQADRSYFHIWRHHRMQQGYRQGDSRRNE